jgi:hypothetical protein
VLTGSFTYARRTGRVDITLILPQPGGKEVREATLFAGEAPGDPRTAPPPAVAAPTPTPVSAAPPPSADLAALKTENFRLREDNARHLERIRLLEKAMEELRKVIQREEQRKRLEVQSPDTAK